MVKTAKNKKSKKNYSRKIIKRKKHMKKNKTFRKKKRGINLRTKTLKHYGGDKKVEMTNMSKTQPNTNPNTNTNTNPPFQLNNEGQWDNPLGRNNMVVNSNTDKKKRAQSKKKTTAKSLGLFKDDDPNTIFGKDDDNTDKTKNDPVINDNNIKKKMNEIVELINNSKTNDEWEKLYQLLNDWEVYIKGIEKNEEQLNVIKKEENFKTITKYLINDIKNKIKKGKGELEEMERTKWKAVRYPAQPQIDEQANYIAQLRKKLTEFIEIFT